MYRQPEGENVIRLPGSGIFRLDKAGLFGKLVSVGIQTYTLHKSLCVLA